jgi:hypothetical protein
MATSCQWHYVDGNLALATGQLIGIAEPVRSISRVSQQHARPLPRLGRRCTGVYNLNQGDLLRAKGISATAEPARLPKAAAPIPAARSDLAYRGSTGNYTLSQGSLSQTRSRGLLRAAAFHPYRGTTPLQVP